MLSVTVEDVKVRFSEILKVNVFQDPYLNETTWVDLFRYKAYRLQEIMISK